MMGLKMTKSRSFRSKYINKWKEINPQCWELYLGWKVSIISQGKVGMELGYFKIFVLFRQNSQNILAHWNIEYSEYFDDFQKPSRKKTP